MTTPPAIEGQLVDAKNIAVHKTVRLSIDVPAELGAKVIEMFGWATMANPVPVAIAKLNPSVQAPQPEPAITAKPNGKKAWHELSPAQQAGIHCNDRFFWQFLREKGESE